MALWRERVSAAMPFIDTAGGLGCDVILLSEEFPGELAALQLHSLWRVPTAAVSYLLQL